MVLTVYTMLPPSVTSVPLVVELKVTKAGSSPVPIMLKTTFCDVVAPLLSTTETENVSLVFWSCARAWVAGFELSNW